MTLRTRAVCPRGATLIISEVGPAHGRPVLLSPPLDIGLRALQPVMEGLASRGYRVFAGDHRGQGTNAVKRGHLDITLTGMTADAMSVIDGLGLRKPHVVGQGLGGLVALALAAWRPDLIASATAIAASAEADDHRETSASILDDLRGCRLPVLALSGAGERPTPHHISGAAVAAVPGGRQVTNVALGQLDVLIEHLEEQFAIADHASGDATDG